jgi:hypothetical protein
MTTIAFPMPPSSLPPNPLFSHPVKPSHRRTPSQPQIIIPSIRHTATRLQCLSNHKLRLESSRNEPQLRKLLGHISIYDNVRECRREQLSQTACPSEPPPYLDTECQQQQKQRTPTTNELQEYLQLQQVRIPSFQDFQAAIELQLATLSEIRMATKKLHALSLDCPSIDEDDEDSANVQEYCESDSESDTVSEYDSYDGDGAWRDDEDEDVESEDSMTDPESVRSGCSSPVEGEENKDDYFGLRPLVPLVGALSVNF